MTKRMNEEKAIVELKKVKEYYRMKRQGYDDIIKWLEGRIKRKKARKRQRRENNDS